MEQKRGCGYKVVGGIYLEGLGIAEPCDRLPIELHTCPTCYGGISFFRGFKWLKWIDYAGRHNQCSDRESCYVCNPNAEPYGLMFVGERHYSPTEFTIEALTMGVSKKIAFVPEKLEVGKTKVLLAHKKAIEKKEIDQSGQEITKKVAAIFYAFVVTRVVKIITQREAADSEAIEALRKRGITPLVATKVNSDGEALETKELHDYIVGAIAPMGEETPI